MVRTRHDHEAFRYRLAQLMTSYRANQRVALGHAVAATELVRWRTLALGELRDVGAPTKADARCRREWDEAWAEVSTS